MASSNLLSLLCWLVASLGFTTAELYVMNPGIFHCPNGTNAQSSLDLDQVLGMWYAVEIVNHRDDGKQPAGRSVVNSCPVLHLTRLDTYMIRLLWKEKPGDLEFKFHITDLDRPGFWLSSGPQNGSMLHTTGTYRQFAGTVEVTKAVASHMVLTFCAPGSELYSVVMSRQSRLPQVELRGVNRMLENRGLNKFTVREACRDSAVSASLNTFLLLFTLFLLKNHPS